MKWINIKDKLPEFTSHLYPPFPCSQLCLVKDKDNKKYSAFYIKRGTLGKNKKFIGWKPYHFGFNTENELDKFSESITHWVYIDDL